MRIAITGATGFVGSHLVRELGAGEHEFVLVARGTDERTDLLDQNDTQFVSASVNDSEALREAFADCEAVAHLAGINYERGDQTYEAVHVTGTRNVVEAADAAGVSKLLLTSYLRARPDCGSGYHESKWEAEKIVRQSGLEYTVVKPGVIYGRGDQMLWGIARALVTVPVFPRIGFRARRLRPVAIEDVTTVLAAAITDNQLSNSTVALLGPEELTLAELVTRVGEVIGRNPLLVPAPVWTQYGLSWLQERVLETPLVTTAGVRMLAEGVTKPAPGGVCDPLPQELQPEQPFSSERIEEGLPPLEPFGLSDLRI